MEILGISRYEALRRLLNTVIIPPIAGIPQPKNPGCKKTPAKYGIMEK